MTREPDYDRPLPGGPTQSDLGDASRRPARQRLPRAAALTLALGLTVTPVLAACSSGAAHASGSVSSAVSAACTQVGAALSDGPDPQADPVGYAEAQIKPLRAIKTSDPALRTAISDLAAAYARVFDSNGTNDAATAAVASASKKVNAICPGSTS
jgi:hypothetical protein